MELLIFCQSYPQIKNTLYLVTKHIDSRQIMIVIPGNNELHKFFKLVSERLFNNALIIIYFKRHEWRITGGKRIKKAFYILPDIIRERQYLKGIHDKYFIGIRGAEVFFFSRHWCDYTFFLLRKLSKANRLAYIPDPGIDVLDIYYTIPSDFISLVNLFIAKSVFGHEITLGKCLNQTVTCIPEKFMQSRISKVISAKQRDESLRRIDWSDFEFQDIVNHDVLYFDHNISPEIVRPGHLKDTLNNVFKMLCKYFSENRIARKYHPGHNNDKTTIKIGDVLPDFIPAEYLPEKRNMLYLSPWSTSIANRKQGLAVALIDLLPFEDEKLKLQFKSLLARRSKTEILFPETLNEFENILSDFRQNLA